MSKAEWNFQNLNARLCDNQMVIAHCSRNRTKESIEKNTYRRTSLHGSLPCRHTLEDITLIAELSLHYEQPLVAPQLTHLRQVPLRTMVNCLHSGQGSPSYPFTLALCTSVNVSVSRIISTCLATPCPFP